MHPSDLVAEANWHGRFGGESSLPQLVQGFRVQDMFVCAFKPNPSFQSERDRQRVGCDLSSKFGSCSASFYLFFQGRQGAGDHYTGDPKPLTGMIRSVAKRPFL